MGEPRLEPWSYCTTDVQGRFYLDDLDGVLFLLAANEKGFVRIATNRFSSNMVVKLEPWGRIEGTVSLYDKVVTNELVWAAVNEDGTVRSRNARFETKTDDHGRFRFDYVPPGKFSIGRPGMVEVGMVKCGETAVMKIGGSGRPVIGMFKIRNPYVEIEWGKKSDFYFFNTKGPDLPKGSFKSPDDIIAWSKQPEIARAFEKLQFREVQFDKDGSFRIDQVNPGTYSLSAAIHDPREASWSTNFIATYEGKFEIPTGKANALEPFDLGVIEISLK